MSSKTKTNNAPYSHVAYYDAWHQTQFLKHSEKTECNSIEMAWANKSRDRYQGEGCKNLWDCTAIQNEFDLSKGERQSKNNVMAQQDCCTSVNVQRSSSLVDALLGGLSLQVMLMQLGGSDPKKITPVATCSRFRPGTNSTKETLTKDQIYHACHREAQRAGARLYYKTTLKERRQQKKIQSCSDDKDSVCRFYLSHEVSEVTEDLSTLEEEVENWKHLLGKDFWKPGKECWKSLHGILTETEI
ncbi:hypothetical protein C8J56DRAFT_894325 [Mycena floridula]|nr:hypothetical protein C8J56DRAFT_894325 [Mycena floridula]